MKITHNVALIFIRFFSVKPTFRRSFGLRICCIAHFLHCDSVFKRRCDGKNSSETESNHNFVVKDLHESLKITTNPKLKGEDRI